VKLISGNHLKFYLTDSRHNIFHWLIVVLLRIIYSLIIVPFSTYTIALGFFLSAETIKPYSPPGWLEKAIFYSDQLPFFSLIKHFFISRLTYWYHEALVWWTMVIGLPLILLATTIFLINLFNLYYSIFSPFYNRTHCPFCRHPIRAKIE